MAMVLPHTPLPSWRGRARVRGNFSSNEESPKIEMNPSLYQL
jgi:hypothetical protein